MRIVLNDPVDSVGLAGALRVSISNKLPGRTEAAGPQLPLRGRDYRFNQISNWASVPSGKCLDSV